LNQIGLIFHSPCCVHDTLSLPLKRLLESAGQYGSQRTTQKQVAKAKRDWGSNMIWDSINTTDDISSMGANADAFLALGMKYCIGHGVTQDNVTAHKWFNIAAIKGSEKAKSYRLELSQEMTAAEIAEAQRQARQFLTLH
jgi:uncharacterized protein